MTLWLVTNLANNFMHEFTSYLGYNCLEFKNCIQIFTKTSKKIIPRLHFFDQKHKYCEIVFKFKIAVLIYFKM